MTTAVLTIIGDDRPGLVNALAKAVADAGGNWLESELARLGGKFAGVVLVDAGANSTEQLRSAVGELSGEGLSVTVTEAGEVATSGETFHLHLLGADRLGIVREISGVLAAKGVTIDELHTTTLEAPMSGGVLFEADAIVRPPAGMGPHEVRSALEAIADELMVDLDLTEVG